MATMFYIFYNIRFISTLHVKSTIFKNIYSCKQTMFTVGTFFDIRNLIALFVSSNSSLNMHIIIYRYHRKIPSNGSISFISFWKYPMRELIYSKQFDYETSFKKGMCLHTINRFVNFISDDTYL